MYMTIIEKRLGWKGRGGDGVSGRINNEYEKFHSLREGRLEGFNRKKVIFIGAIVRIHKEI
jgi:hypothetical protein